MQILDSRPGLKKRSMCILVGKSGYATFPIYEEHIMPKNLTASLKMGYLRHNIVSLTRTNIEKFLLRDIRAILKEGNMKFYEGTLEFYVNGNLELKLDYKFLPDGSVLHDNLCIPLITSQEIIEYLT